MLILETYIFTYVPYSTHTYDEHDKRGSIEKYVHSKSDAKIQQFDIIDNS